MEQQANNRFLEGIVADRTPLDSDPNAITDAVNATIFSSKGDQLVKRIMKSIVPVESEEVLLDADGNTIPTEPGTQFAGLGPDNKILGVKTHNDLAYIVSGVPAVYQAESFTRIFSQKTIYESLISRFTERARDYLPDHYGLSTTNDIEEKDAIGPDAKFFNHREGARTGSNSKTHGGELSYTKTWETGYHNFFVDIDFSTKDFSGSSTNAWVEIYKGSNRIQRWPSAEGEFINARGGAQTIKKSFSEYMSGLDTIKVVTKLQVKDNARTYLKCYGGLSYTEPRIVSTSSEKIKNFLTESGTVITKASNTLSSDGNIIFNNPCERNANGELQYYTVQLNGAPFLNLFGDTQFNAKELYAQSWIGYDISQGLPPGDYLITVSFSDTKDTKSYSRTELVTIGANVSVEPIEVTSKLKNFSGVDSSFSVDVEVNDSSKYAGIQYKYGYTYINSEGETKSYTYATTSDTEKTITVNTPTNEDISLNIFVEEATTYPGTVYYSAEATHTKRKCVDILPIYDDLKNNKYQVEVGTFPSPDYVEEEGPIINMYKPLQNYNGGDFICDKIFLSGSNYLDIEIQQIYDDSVNIIFTEQGQTSRSINSGFAAQVGDKYVMRTTDSERTSNQYTSSNIELKSRLIQSTSVIPDFIVKKVHQAGGKLPVGTYQYYIRFGTINKNETGIIAETGLIPIYHGNTIGTIKGGKSGEETECAVEFKLNNIDSNFDHVSLYFVRNTGDDRPVTEAFKVDKSFIIKSMTTEVVKEFTFTHTGFEPHIQVPESSLSDVKEYYNSIKTIAQVQNRLFTGNISSFNIDYNKLFNVGRKIVAVPSANSRSVHLSNLYTKWGARSDFDFFSFTEEYINKDLNSDGIIADVNRKSPMHEVQNLLNMLHSQGFYNPLYTANYTSYWPMETYKLGVCFRMEGDVDTKPVPILSADYSNYGGYIRELDSDKVMYYDDYDRNSVLHSTANAIRSKIGSTTFSSWDTIKEGTNSGDLEINNIGIMRFPYKSHPSSQMFPKFDFDLEELKRTYPEFFSRVKGMYFVRTDRTPDALMEGAILPTKLVPTIKTEYTKNPNYNDIPSDNIIKGIDPDGEPDKYSAVPFITNNASGSATLDYLLSGFLDENDENLIRTLVQPHNDDIFNEGDYIKTALKTANILNLVGLSKYAFYSGDLIPYLSRVAASFNGQSFSIVPTGRVDLDINAKLDTTQSNGYTQVFGRFIDGASTAISGSVLPVKVTGEFIDYGRSIRSGSGFASQIPYLAGWFKAAKTAESDLTYYPTGNFGAYIGLSGKLEGYNLTNQSGLIYPGANGPITISNLKAMHNSDTLTGFKSITPIYSMEAISNEMSSGIIGTRGDCFIPMTWHNVARTLPSIGVNPTSDLPGVLLNSGDDTSLKNGYNAGDASMNIVTVNSSTYLNFARHNEVEDEVESALYGKARGFLPSINASDYKLYLDRNSKLPDSKAFNQGYKAHFTGRTLYNVSSDTPFTSSVGANTIAYSEQVSTGSIYNAYRDFYSTSNQDFNKELGGITKLVSFYNNLIAVHEKGVIMVGINDQTIVGQNTGGNVYTDSASVMNPKSKILSNTIGTKWLRSVCQSENAVYGVDTDNFKVWTTSGEGLHIISDGKVNRILSGILKEFKNITEVPGEVYIATHYDSMKGDVIFTFYNKDSVYTEYPLPMDVDEYYMIKGMDEEERNPWVTQPITDLDISNSTQEEVIKVKVEVLRRKRILDQFSKVDDNYSPVNHITLVYNEYSKTWVTRLSHSPEFAFNVKDSFYSINNESYSNQLPEFLSTYTGYKLIWDHNGINKNIPTYGSMYGQDPVFEIEFVINNAPMHKKLFKKMTIIGNESKPSEVVYTLPDSNPWYNILQSTRFHSGFIDGKEDDATTWSDVMESYLDKLIEGEWPTTNPFTLIKQDIHDRRNSPIYKANYQFSKTNNTISIGKNLTPLFWGQGDNTKDLTTNFSDKWLKVRIKYNSGEYTYLNTILTDYLILH